MAEEIYFHILLEMTDLRQANILPIRLRQLLFSVQNLTQNLNHSIGLGGFVIL